MKFTFGPESRPLDGYTIKRAIARGGFGEVYYALTDSGKEVALKLLQENMEVELRGVTQCLNLKCANLVTIYDIKQDRDGDHWIVMEYVGGKTLDRVIHEHPHGMPLAEVLAWLDGLAGGIGFLHERGLVHRDLKPANVFRENGVVKVGDVGLSKFIAPSRRSAHTQSVGTVYYMAPEVAKGRYGREVDVYSTAVILYEMLTGKVPFDGETTAEILMKHLTERPNLDAISPSLRPVFERALEKDPQRRTPDVAELARQFRAAAAGDATSRLNETPAAATAVSPVVIPSPQLLETQPFSQPVRNSVFRAPAPPQNPLAGFVYAVRESLAGAWRHHPFLVMAVIAGAVFWLRPQMRVASGSQLAMMAIGTLIAIEIFRSVSRFVDRLFSDEHVERRKPTSSYGRKLNRPAAYRAVDPNTMRIISWRRRFTELSGSLAVAGLATSLVTTALAYTTSFFPAPALLGHFAGATLVASWGLLVLGKLREGHRREPYLDRLLLAGVGAVVGFGIFQLDQFLMIDLPMDGWSQKDGMFVMSGLPMVDAAHQPILAGYIAFFATLFGLRRWWWHTDSCRPHRFRVMSILLTTALGAVLARVWGFPMLWGTVWAASLSSVVQLASAWTPPEHRV